MKIEEEPNECIPINDDEEAELEIEEKEQGEEIGEKGEKEKYQEFEDEEFDPVAEFYRK